MSVDLRATVRKLEAELDMVKRAMGDRACAHCGMPIAGRRNKRYCGGGCRVAASRERKRSAEQVGG